MFCAMPDNLNSVKKHSYPWQTLTLKYTLTNFCESSGEDKTHRRIDAAFETWRSVCGLKFAKVEARPSVDSHDSNSDADIKI